MRGQFQQPWVSPGCPWPTVEGWHLGGSCHSPRDTSMGLGQGSEALWEEGALSTGGDWAAGRRLLPEGGWALPQPMPQPRGAWPAGPLQGFCTPCLSWVEAVWLL